MLDQNASEFLKIIQFARGCIDQSPIAPMPIQSNELMKALKFDSLNPFAWNYLFEIEKNDKNTK